MINLFKVFISHETIAEVTKTLYSGQLTQGPVVEEFEIALQNYLKSSVKPLTVNSCTSAISLALHLCNINENSEVITSPMTCSATNVHLLHRKAKIVWADVDPQYGIINVNDVKKKITQKTDAIITVDWAGKPCNYEELKDLHIPVIQDAAHSFGSEAGGDYICYSFQAIKHLTCGDGGALIVPECEYKRAKLLRWYGLDRETKVSFRSCQDISEAGYKYHMNDINATIGLHNLKHVDFILDKHKRNAKYFCDNLKNSRIKKPEYSDNCSWWLYTILVDDINKFKTYMTEKEIEVSQVHYRNDLYTCFQPYRSYFLPGLRDFFDYQISIPVGWWITLRELEYITKAINDYS